MTESSPRPSGTSTETTERFVVEGRLVWLTCEEAEALPEGVRVKCSAALWRARARRGMDLMVRLEPDWSELSALLPYPL